MNKINISPSIMCADLVNLESSIKDIEKLNVDSLHVDIIDGSFSPSMPLGIDTVKKIRSITSMKFDTHIMAMDNEFFVKELLDIGSECVTFHYETTLHIDRLINMIKKKGSKVGIALNPATSLSVLDYILPQCDKVLLMLINPGFATDKSEDIVSYAAQKVSDLRQMIDSKNLDVEIQVDGRVSFEAIPSLIKAGANNLVVGSTGLFVPGNSLEENKAKLDSIIANALK